MALSEAAHAFARRLLSAGCPAEAVMARVSATREEIDAIFADLSAAPAPRGGDEAILDGTDDPLTRRVVGAVEHFNGLNAAMTEIIATMALRLATDELSDELAKLYERTPRNVGESVASWTARILCEHYVVLPKHPDLSEASAPSDGG